MCAAKGSRSSWGPPPFRHFRAHARYALRLDVAVVHLGAGWRADADLVDLGLGGACIAGRHGLIASPLETATKGDRVAASFLAPTLWDPVVLDARVAWSRREAPNGRARVGLAFEPEEAASLLALLELIAAARA